LTGQRLRAGVPGVLPSLILCPGAGGGAVALGCCALWLPLTRTVTKADLNGPERLRRGETTASGTNRDQARVSVGWSAENVGLVSEVGDDLQLAAKGLHVGGQGLYLALSQLALLDPGDASLADAHGGGDFDLSGVLALADFRQSPIGYELWEALGRQLDWLEKHWELPDDGIWESRGGRKRSTYSAVMAWVAFERAIRIGRQRGMPAPIAHWRRLANSCYQTVQRDGWDPGRQAYCQYLGGTVLDASMLVMPLVKFTSPSDRRSLATLDRIGEELVSDSLVRRYEPDGSDGLAGSEGTFNLCSFWYVEALARAGRIQEGRYVFEKMLTHANHVGLFAEEIGPAGDALGNFPQAFTHLALISAADSLDRAMSSELPPL
jgi:hypothetical protein